MRNSEEIRDQLLINLRSVVTKPGMVANDGRAVEVLALTLVGHIDFVDERERGSETDRLRRYGKEGVTGPFRALFGPGEALTSEVGAIMAHEAHRSGYLEVGRLLAPDEFTRIRSEIRGRFDEVDLLASEIEAELGEPTFQVRDDVWAYGSTDVDDGWIFLAFRSERDATYEPGSGRWTYHRDTDRLLRIVWTSEGPFEETLALPLRTKLEIWGPGWSWNHGWRSDREAPPGVRESLQAIHDADPSQRLRRPGFAE